MFKGLSHLYIKEIAQPPCKFLVLFNSVLDMLQLTHPFHGPFFEYVALLPLDMKLRNGWTKYSFRLAMKDMLPEKIQRSNIGFETRQKKWIEKELQTLLRPKPKSEKRHNLETFRNLLNRPTFILNIKLWYQELFAKRERFKSRCVRACSKGNTESHVYESDVYSRNTA